MAAGRREYRGCKRKRRHHSRGEAMTQIKQVRRRFGNHGLQVYPCCFCKGWHVGHRKGHKMPSQK